MNQRIETAPDTIPQASTDHEALVIDICSRGLSVFESLAETLTMSAEDRAGALGEILDELDAERARIVGAREEAYRMAELESLLEDPDADENRWNAEHNGGAP